MQIQAQLDALNIGGTASWPGNKSPYDADNLNQAAAMLAAGAIHAQVPPPDAQQQQALAFDTTQRLLGLQSRNHERLPSTGVSAPLQWKARTYAAPHTFPPPHSSAAPQ